MKYTFSHIVCIFKQVFLSCLPKSNKKKRSHWLSSPRVWTKPWGLTCSVQVRSHVHLKNPSLRPWPCQGHLFSHGARINSMQTGLSVGQGWFCSGAFTKSRDSMLLADDRYSLFFLIARPCAGGWYKDKHDKCLPCQNLNPLIYVTIPLPIHLLKSKL